MRPLRFRAVAVALTLFLPGLIGPRDTSAADTFSLMTYNLMRFSYEDRDQDGQKDNFKPEDQIAALMQILQKNRPDVLAVQEMGDAAAFGIFTQRVAAAGLDYPHHAYLLQNEASVGLAVLSRFPITDRRPITNETYTIEEETLPVQRGFLGVDIEVNPEYRFRLVVAHLKSKLYHPLGQTEMRRNEARLLNKNVRRMLNQNPELNLVVVGDMNDTITSAALRELIGEPPVLVDLRPVDSVGDLWSHFWAYQESYERLDYILVSAGMHPEVVSNQCRVVRDPLTYQASDHRPVLAGFTAREQQPAPPAGDNSGSGPPTRDRAR